MSNNQSLKRIFASASVNKYATVGKFLGSASPSVTATVDPEPVSTPVPEPEPDLDLLDNLVEQALLNRQLTNPANTDQVSASPARAKEALLNRSLDQGTVDSSSESAVESTAENAQETPLSAEAQEISKELQEVSKETKEQREQAMIKEKQKAINDLAAASINPVAVSDQPVVILPITAQSKEEAKFKNPTYSVKWLWEWCKKISKIFAGAVVYKEEVEEA